MSSPASTSKTPVVAGIRMAPFNSQLVKESNSSQDDALLSQIAQLLEISSANSSDVLEKVKSLYNEHRTAHAVDTIGTNLFESPNLSTLVSRSLSGVSKLLRVSTTQISIFLRSPQTGEIIDCSSEDGIRTYESDFMEFLASNFDPDADIMSIFNDHRSDSLVKSDSDYTISSANDELGRSRSLFPTSSKEISLQVNFGNESPSSGRGPTTFSTSSLGPPSVTPSERSSTIFSVSADKSVVSHNNSLPKLPLSEQSQEENIVNCNLLPKSSPKASPKPPVFSPHQLTVVTDLAGSSAVAASATSTFTLSPRSSPKTSISSPASPTLFSISNPPGTQLNKLPSLNLPDIISSSNPCGSVLAASGQITINPSINLSGSYVYSESPRASPRGNHNLAGGSTLFSFAPSSLTVDPASTASGVPCEVASIEAGAALAISENRIVTCSLRSPVLVPSMVYRENTSDDAFAIKTDTTNSIFPEGSEGLVDTILPDGMSTSSNNKFTVVSLRDVESSIDPPPSSCRGTSEGVHSSSSITAMNSSSRPPPQSFILTCVPFDALRVVVRNNVTGQSAIKISNGSLISSSGSSTTNALSPTYGSVSGMTSSTSDPTVISVSPHGQSIHASSSTHLKSTSSNLSTSSTQNSSSSNVSIHPASRSVVAGCICVHRCSWNTSLPPLSSSNGASSLESLPSAQLSTLRSVIGTFVNTLTRILQVSYAAESHKRTTGIVKMLKSISHEVALPAVIANLVGVAYDLLQADRVSLFLVDHEKKELMLAVSEDAAGFTIPIGKGIAGAAASTGVTFNIPDAYDSSLFDRSFDLKTGYRTKSVLCMPIRSSDGVIVAVLQAINKRTGGSFTGVDISTLSTVADTAGVTLHKAKLLQEANTARAANAALVDVVKLVNEGSQEDMGTLVKSLVDIAHRIVPADRITLLLVDSVKQELFHLSDGASSFGLSSGGGMGANGFSIASSASSSSLSMAPVPHISCPTRIPFGSGLSGLCAQSGEMMNLVNPFSDARFDYKLDLDPEDFAGSQLEQKEGEAQVQLDPSHGRSMLLLPVRQPLAQGGRVVAVLRAFNRRGAAMFSDLDISLFKAFSTEVGVIVDRRSLELAFDRALVEDTATGGQSMLSSLLGQYVRSPGGGLQRNGTHRRFSVNSEGFSAQLDEDFAPNELGHELELEQQQDQLREERKGHPFNGVDSDLESEEADVRVFSPNASSSSLLGLADARPVAADAEVDVMKDSTVPHSSTENNLSIAVSTSQSASLLPLPASPVPSAPVSGQSSQAVSPDNSQISRRSSETASTTAHSTGSVTPTVKVSLLGRLRAQVAGSPTARSRAATPVEDKDVTVSASEKEASATSTNSSSGDPDSARSTTSVSPSNAVGGTTTSAPAVAPNPAPQSLSTISSTSNIGSAPKGLPKATSVQGLTVNVADSQKEPQKEPSSSTLTIRAVAATTTPNPASGTRGLHSNSSFRSVGSTASGTGFGGSSLPNPVRLYSVPLPGRTKEHLSIRSWGFNTLAVPSSNLPIYILDMLQTFDLFSILKIDPDIMYQFVCAVQSRYRPNAYHNFMHAAGVAHVSFLVLYHSRLAHSVFCPLETLAVLLAGLCHDVDHPGVNNTYESNAMSPLAVVYNDQSVLENHHAAVMFQLLQSLEGYEHTRQPLPFANSAVLALSSTTGSTQVKAVGSGLQAIRSLAEERNNAAPASPEASPASPSPVVDMENRPTSILGLPRKDFIQLRKLSISAILATDMMHHNSLTDQVRRKAPNDPETTPKLLAELIVHSADLSNPVLPDFSVVAQWSGLVCAEFSLQAAREQQEGLPFAPHMVALYNLQSVAKLQVGFIDYVVSPFWSSLGNFLPEINGAVECMTANRNRWKAIVDGTADARLIQDADEGLVRAASCCKVYPYVSALAASITEAESVAPVDSVVLNDKPEKADDNADGTSSARDPVPPSPTPAVVVK